MIRAIIFDCFGVLTVDRWHAFCANFAGQTRTALHDLTLMRARGMLSADEFTLQASKATGRSKKEVAEALSYGHGKNRALLDIIASLKRKGIKIGMLSNIGDNWVREEFLNSEELALFDDIVLSYEVGLAKPDRRIFNMSADRLGVAASQCIFVDDNSGYCMAAEQVGMGSIVYAELEKFQTELKQFLK